MFCQCALKGSSAGQALRRRMLGAANCCERDPRPQLVWWIGKTSSAYHIGGFGAGVGVVGEGIKV